MLVKIKILDSDMKDKKLNKQDNPSEDNQQNMKPRNSSFNFFKWGFVRGMNQKSADISVRSLSETGGRPYSSVLEAWSDFPTVHSWRP